MRPNRSHDLLIRAVREVGDTDVSAGRAATQLGWYEFAAQFVCGKTVLDVGCGLGAGLEILHRSARSVEGQDLDERLATRREIRIGPIENIPDDSFDVVVAIEVIEHVQNDQEFVKQLARLAREAIFLTTPNWTITRCQWPYHVREYTPRQLEDILARVGTVRLFKGDSRGNAVFPVRSPRLYHLMNSLRISPATALGMQSANRLLPKRLRLCGHNAALVTHLRKNSVASLARSGA